MTKHRNMRRRLVCARMMLAKLPDNPHRSPRGTVWRYVFAIFISAIMWTNWGRSSAETQVGFKIVNDKLPGELRNSLDAGAKSVLIANFPDQKSINESHLGIEHVLFVEKTVSQFNPADVNRLLWSNGCPLGFPFIPFEQRKWIARKSQNTKKRIAANNEPKILSCSVAAVRQIKTNRDNFFQSNGLRIDNIETNLVQVHESSVARPRGLISFVQDPSRNASYNGQNDREITEAARPSRHHSLIYLMFGCFLLLISFVTMALAFESAEYADDKGFLWWPIPLIGLAVISIWFAVHGIVLLTTTDRHSEDVGIAPIVVSELTSAI